MKTFKQTVAPHRKRERHAKEETSNTLVPKTPQKPQKVTTSNLRAKQLNTDNLKKKSETVINTSRTNEIPQSPHKNQTH